MQEASATLPSHDRIAAALRGFGPIGLVAIAAVVAASIVTTSVGAIVVLAWAAASRTPWNELGFRRPKALSLAAAVALGAIFKLAMKGLVMPLFGAPAVNARYHYIAGNAAALPSIIAAVILAGGVAEELVFRGWLFERLGRVFGTGAVAKMTMVLISACLFASAHYRDQGIAGVEQAVFTGLVFASVFAVTSEIWSVMIAHAAFDLMAIALIYFDLESAVAQALFHQG
jgi:uncharacterized protein